MAPYLNSPRAQEVFSMVLVEILVRIAHVGIFRFVTDLRRKFRVAGMNVRNVRRQQGVIAFVPSWKWKGQDLNKTRHVTCACTSQPAPNAITSAGGITFGLVDLVDSHKKLSRSDEKIRKTAAEFARGPVIIRGRVLNISETNSGKAKHQ